METEDKGEAKAHRNTPKGVPLAITALIACLAAAISIFITVHVMSKRASVRINEAVLEQKTLDTRHADDALLVKAAESLGKLNAGVQVGVNYPKYYSLLLDAKADVNALQKLHSNLSPRNLANKTLQNFVDAGKVWNVLVKYPSANNNALFLSTLITTPPLKGIWKTYKFKRPAEGNNKNYTTLRKARNMIWEAATENFKLFSQRSNTLNQTRQSNGSAPATARTIR